MCQDYSVTKTKNFLTKFFKTFSKKPSHQAVERMYLYQSGSFVQALLCFSAVWLFTPPFFRIRADALDV